MSDRVGFVLPVPVTLKTGASMGKQIWDRDEDSWIARDRHSTASLTPFHEGPGRRTLFDYLTDTSG
jgi:hypothetical protein